MPVACFFSGLRKALNNGGSGPGFIVTAQVRGYRLLDVSPRREGRNSRAND